MDKSMSGPAQDAREARVAAQEATTGVRRLTMILSLFMLTLIALVVAAAMTTDIFKVEYNGTTRFQVDQQGTTTINADSTSSDVALKILSASSSRGDMKFSVRTADPTSPGAGDMWYNSSENRYKLYDGFFKRYLLFDLTQAVNDATVNANHGTRGANNSAGGDDPAWTTDAKLGGCALTFNGTSHFVNVTNGWTNTINADDTHTIELWIYPRSLVNVPVLINAGGTGATRTFVELGNNAGNIFYWYYSNSGRNYSGTVLALNQWHHIAAVKTGAGDSGNLYIDGVLQTSYVGSLGNAPNVSSDLLIGKYAGAGYETNGIIDEVAIWNVALTPAEVAARYNGGAGVELAGNESGLVSVWHMNDPK